MHTDTCVYHTRVSTTHMCLPHTHMIASSYVPQRLYFSHTYDMIILLRYDYLTLSTTDRFYLHYIPPTVCCSVSNKCRTLVCIFTQCDTVCIFTQCDTVCMFTQCDTVCQIALHTTNIFLSTYHRYIILRTTSLFLSTYHRHVISHTHDVMYELLDILVSHANYYRHSILSH